MELSKLSFKIIDYGLPPVVQITHKSTGIVDKFTEYEDFGTANRARWRAITRIENKINSLEGER